MRLVNKAAAVNVMVLMVDSTDHVTGKTGLTLTITASKNGAAFASISPTVTERGDGWYNIALTAADTDTEGDLALHITSSGADPSDVLMNVNVLAQLIRNKRVLDATTGIETIYDDSGNALFTRQVYENAAGTQTYRGQGADRVERYA